MNRIPPSRSYMLTTNELLRKLETYHRDDGLKRSHWWFLFDPTSKGVFHHGIKSTSDWLDYESDMKVGGFIYRYLIGDKLVGYIRCGKTVSKMKASHDLKINCDYLRGIPRNQQGMYRKTMDSLELISKTRSEKEDLNHFNDIWRDVKRCVSKQGSIDFKQLCMNDYLARKDREYTLEWQPK